jgi:uncharacterized membrane protein YfcA
VSWLSALLLFLAGIGAGLSGSIAGLASLFSYPALLAVGLSPLTANVTNTVALVFSSIGSVGGSGPELRDRDRRRTTRHLAVATAGGLAGGLLLIATPPTAFEKVVPVLIGLGAMSVLLPRRTAGHDRHPAREPRWLLPVLFGIGVYSGYFGAAAGVLLLALYLAATSDTLPVCNALKNLVLGVSNGVAAILFVLTTHIDWIAVPALALGLLAGGWAGSTIVRHAPVRPLRWLIALAGAGLAIRLGIQQYA